jgi:uncharacterized protein (UPF0548 family)
MVELLQARVIGDLQAQDLTYPEVGASRGSLPVGYHHQHLSTSIGFGSRQFGAAAEALLGWEMHRRAGVTPLVSHPRVEPGAVAVLRLRLGPLTLQAPVRVVEVLDEPTRQGFTYGTLPGHPERGEETCVVEQDGQGSVRFGLVAFSRPGRWYTRLGAPVARASQLLMAERYAGALHAVTESVTDDGDPRAGR